MTEVFSESYNEKKIDNIILVNLIILLKSATNYLLTCPN